MLIKLTFLCVLATIVVGSSPRRRVVGTVAPSGRMIEEFNEPFRANLDNDTRTKLSVQMEQDRINDAYTPNVASSFEERTPLGYLSLGSQIHEGTFTAVFEVVGHSNWIIKYQAHCSRLDDNVHPLLRDAWYANETNSIGLAPRVHFVSPPSNLCDSRIDKCGFTMNEDQWEICDEQRSPLRYMIMDRVHGMSLHRYRMNQHARFRGAMSVADAMIVGFKLLSVLKKIHMNSRIVHGDIHSPNIMIEITNGTSGNFELKLIDFGCAFRYPETPLPDIPVFDASYWYHEFFTQWQIDGFAWAARDDVMKAIQVVAQIMHPYSYFGMERRIKYSGSRGLRDWKENANWFVLADRDPVEHLAIPESSRFRIYALLEEILRIGRSMDINAPPPYEELKAAMLECARLASNFYSKSAAPSVVAPTLN